MFSLRPDQQSLIDQIEAALAAGEAPCAVAPTGAGKTVLLAETARRALDRGEQVVAIAHRAEIVQQIVTSLRRHLGPYVSFDVITAGSRPRYRASVTIGMVPTMSRRLPRLAPLRGCTLLADEAHHCGATSWGNTIDALAPRRLVGFTATPLRPDGKGMGDIGRFHRLILGPQPGELMAAGSLCRYRMFAAPRQISSKGLRKVAGDFRGQDMEKRVVEINGDIVPDWLRFNPDRLRTIFVGVSVDHAHTVAALFLSQGIPAEAVDGKTPAAERAAIFARFRDGKTVVLCACAVVDEGLDVPEATCLQLTRPTASLRLYRQLVGRVLRPAPGKVEALILDHTDNWQRLPAPDAAIDWQLNSEVQLPTEPRQMVANLETGEVTAAEPDPLEVQSTGARLAEVLVDETPGGLILRLIRNPEDHDWSRVTEAESDLLDLHHFSVKQRVAWMNAKVRTLLYMVDDGKLPASELKPWAQRLAILDERNIEHLGVALGRAKTWASTQLALNGMQSAASRNRVLSQAFDKPFLKARRPSARQQQAHQSATMR